MLTQYKALLEWFVFVIPNAYENVSHHQLLFLIAVRSYFS